MPGRIISYRDCIITSLYRRRGVDGQNGTLFSSLVEDAEIAGGSELNSIQRKRLLDTCGKLMVEDVLQMIGKGPTRKFIYIPFNQRRAENSSNSSSSSESEEDVQEAQEGPPESEPLTKDDVLPFLVPANNAWSSTSNSSGNRAYNSNGDRDPPNPNGPEDSVSSASEDSENETETCEICGSSRKISAIVIEPLL